VASVQNPTLPEGTRTVSADICIALTDVQSIVNYADRRDAWVVILVHARDVVDGLREVVLSVIPHGSFSGGRTMLLPGGSRVSVCCVSDAVCVPDGEPFEIIALRSGTPTPEQNRGLSRWVARADRSVDLTRIGESVA